MLNSIGLDNDGIEGFIAEHLPYLATIGCPAIVSIAGSSHGGFRGWRERLERSAGRRGAGVEHLLPQRVGRGGFRLASADVPASGAGVREATDLPLLAKLTPNVTDIVAIAQAADEGGADALTLINTLLGMAVDWRQQRPLLGNVMGGLSGPAIKPMALRCVYQVARAVPLPIVGVGGIGDARRRDGVPGGRGHRRADRHGQFLQSDGVDADPG